MQNLRRNGCEQSCCLLCYCYGMIFECCRRQKLTFLGRLWPKLQGPQLRSKCSNV